MAAASSNSSCFGATERAVVPPVRFRPPHCRWLGLAALLTARVFEHTALSLANSPPSPQRRHQRTVTSGPGVSADPVWVSPTVIGSPCLATLPIPPVWGMWSS